MYFIAKNLNLPSYILKSSCVTPNRLLLLKLRELLLLLLKLRRNGVGIDPPIRTSTVSEEHEDHDGDEEEADDGFEHGEEAFDVFVVVVFALALLLAIFIA